MAVNNTSGRPAITADQLGIWTSAICFSHCLLMPALLSYSTVFTHFLPSDEWVHRTLSVVIAAIGAIAMLRGFRKHVRRSTLLLMSFGLTVTWATAWRGNLLPSHAAEVIATLIGSSAMIAAHRLNHTFCASCECANPKRECH